MTVDPDNSWRLYSACRGQDPEKFFSPHGERDDARVRRVAAAKAICARCPVVAKCLEEAVELGDNYGVRGGLSEGERRRLIKRRTTAVYDDDQAIDLIREHLRAFKKLPSETWVTCHVHTGPSRAKRLLAAVQAIHA